MDNRDRDKLSQNRKPTSAGDVNRSTSEKEGIDRNRSDASFGQKIGRSEELNEPSRGSRSTGESGMKGSSGRSSSSSGMSGSSRNHSSDDVESDTDRRPSGSWDSSPGDKSKGRH